MTLLKPDVGDAELITAVRGGDVSAYGTLFERHVDAARRLARQLTSPSDADDLVSDAFAKVLRVLQNGGGPDLAFRAYLLTAVRRLHVDKIRAGAKAARPPTTWRSSTRACRSATPPSRASRTPPPPPRSPRCPSAGSWCCGTPRSRARSRPTSAPLLGMSANSVSALAYRAREGLRQAFLNSHINDIDDDGLPVDPRPPRRLRPQRASPSVTRTRSRSTSTAAASAWRSTSS